MKLATMVWRPACTVAAGVLAAGVLAGCANGPRALQAQDSGQLQLALAPAALGCSLAVQQQLTVHAPGQSAQTLEALLEVDAHSVHLALFHMGQRMGTLLWDGQQLQTQLSTWWPAQLPAAQVLSDMQLALWPASAVVQALPVDWSMEEGVQLRRLFFQGQERITVRAAGAQAFDIFYAPVAWQLHVASPGSMQPCAVAQEAP